MDTNEFRANPSSIKNFRNKINEESQSSDEFKPLLDCFCAFVMVSTNTSFFISSSQEFDALIKRLMMAIR